MKEVFGANLKMNPVAEGNPVLHLGNLLLGYLDKGIKTNDFQEVAVFAPALLLTPLFKYFPSLGELLQQKKIRIGAQEVSEHVSGAYTGQTSPVWLRELGITDVLVGHSEVRDDYENLARKLTGVSDFNHPGQIDLLFNRIIKNSLDHGLRVTYCVGETQREKEQKQTDYVIEMQIKCGLEHLTGEALEKRVLIAYEPRWAIGGGKDPPTNEEIEFAHRKIRSVISDYGKNINPSELVIMYGGSMNPKNAKKIMQAKGVNGGLIGSASLDPAKFHQIADYRNLKPNS